MAVIEHVVREVSHLVVRTVVEAALQLEPRQDAPEPSTRTSSKGTSSPTAASPSASSTNDGDGQGNSNSPLLFFVALGFGVVFTNLWIIVGVKYCFRYNARNRALRANAQGDPITLDQMPRTHRRRREKKLMTMEEVNEKFPMIKYKNWGSERARDGLPTSGGVSAPPSRPVSVQDVDGIASEMPSKERDSTDGIAASAAQPTNTAPAEVVGRKESAVIDAVEGEDAGQTFADPATAPVESDHQKDTRTEDEDDDEHINAALPLECVGTSGDTCAICIDTLEDDDDVRGLTCGHAFHAGCVDPWLTTRRACCPLCKADYHTPRARAAASDGIVETAPPAGQYPFQRGPGRVNSLRYHARNRRGLSALLAPLFDRRHGQTETSVEETPVAEPAQSSGLRRFAPPFFSRRGNGNSAAASIGDVATSNPSPVTPSQLEVGGR